MVDIKIIIEIIIGLFVVALVLFVGIFVLRNLRPELMKDACNLNGTVTDVYYDEKLEKCVLTQCSMLWGKNNSQCYYDVPPIHAINGQI